MKRKKIIFFILACIIVFSMGGLFYLYNKLNSYYEFGVCFADAVKYEEIDEIGYLTILFTIDTDTQREMVLQVTDEQLKSKLENEPLENIIGISYILDIPAKKLRENHIKRKEIKSSEILKDNTFDSFLLLTNYSTYTSDNAF